MRHQRKRHRLGRTAPHRKATLAALSSALIQNKRITTTAPKAKALREFVEPIISRAKEDTTHNRRQVFRYLQDNDAVSELFGEVAEKVGDRPGGYTRIIKLGQRHGDAAPMAVIELVDYNDVKPEGAAGGRKKTRRGGRGRKSKADTAASAASVAAGVAEDVAESVEDAVDAIAEEAADVVDTAEAVAEEVAEAVEDSAEAVEDAAENAGETVEEAAEDAVEEAQSKAEAGSDGSDEGEQADDDETEEPKK